MKDLSGSKVHVWTSSNEKLIFVLALLTVAGFAFGPVQLGAASLPPAATVLKHDHQPNVQPIGWREQHMRAQSDKCLRDYGSCRIHCGEFGLTSSAGMLCVRNCGDRKVYCENGHE